MSSTATPPDQAHGQAIAEEQAQQAGRHVHMRAPPHTVDVDDHTRVTIYAGCVSKGPGWRKVDTELLARLLDDLIAEHKDQLVENASR